MVTEARPHGVLEATLGSLAFSLSEVGARRVWSRRGTGFGSGFYKIPFTAE